MDTKEALKRLFKIAQTQQKVLEKLAQAQVGFTAPVPAASPAPQTAGATSPTARLQAVLFAGKQASIRQLFVEPPVVSTAVEGGKSVVSYKYRSSKWDAQLKQAVIDAANATLGQNAFTINAIGMTG